MRSVTVSNLCIILPVDFGHLVESMQISGPVWPFSYRFVNHFFALSDSVVRPETVIRSAKNSTFQHSLHLSKLLLQSNQLLHLFEMSPSVEWVCFSSVNCLHLTPRSALHKTLAWIPRGLDPLYSLNLTHTYKRTLLPWPLHQPMESLHLEGARAPLTTKSKHFVHSSWIRLIMFFAGIFAAPLSLTAS